MSAGLDALFHPRVVVFGGGTNLQPALTYHRELGFDGDTYVVHPTHDQIAGFACVPSLEALPQVPDLAFVAIRADRAVTAIRQLRDIGCKAVICNAAGFAEAGDRSLQADLVAAAGDMVLMGPNSIGVVNFVQPMGAMMDRFGVHRASEGVAVCSQGGGFLCDVVFCDRSLAVTHMVAGGNQAVTGLEACLDYLLDQPSVRAVGLSFETIKDVGRLRLAAAKAMRLGKPIVAIKFGRSSEGARVAATHTASMTGDGAAWEALFERLGIVSTRSQSEFFETLKLFQTGSIPKGRRVMACAVSGVMGVMLADHLSGAGFEMPQPSGARVDRLRAVLPSIATPCNPQDVTMAAWNDLDQQRAIYDALLDEDYDIAIMVQNYPRPGMWDMAEYAAQVEALTAAAKGRDLTAVQLAPMVDCFPETARDHTLELGLVPMQGLEECIRALDHAVWWQEKRATMLATPLPEVVAPPRTEATVRLDEAEGKRLLAEHGVSIPASSVVLASAAAEAAERLGFPVAIKAVSAALLHKSEAGAVRLGLNSGAEVSAAIDTMRDSMAQTVPHIPLDRLLVERMTDTPVAEIMVSVSQDPSVGTVLMLAGGGVEAELWGDSTLLAAPFDRAQIEAGLDRLKTTAKLSGWRGAPSGDRAALVDAILNIAAAADASGATEIEVNPIIVQTKGVVAVDAVATLPAALAQHIAS